MLHIQRQDRELLAGSLFNVFGFTPRPWQNHKLTKFYLRPEVFQCSITHSTPVSPSPSWASGTRRAPCPFAPPSFVVSRTPLYLVSEVARSWPMTPHERPRLPLTRWSTEMILRLDNSITGNDCSQVSLKFRNLANPRARASHHFGAIGNRRRKWPAPHAAASLL